MEVRLYDETECQVKCNSKVSSTSKLLVRVRQQAVAKLPKTNDAFLRSSLCPFMNDKLCQTTHAASSWHICIFFEHVAK